MKIILDTTVAAPIKEAWRACTTRGDIKQWNAACHRWHTTPATVDLPVGGAFSSRMEGKDGSFGFDFGETYTKVVQHQLIGMAFADRTAAVEFIRKDRSVDVQETFGSDKSHSIEQQRQGWRAILDRFARNVEARR